MVVIIPVSFRKKQQGIIMCIQKVSVELLAGLSYPEYTKFTFWVNEVL